MASMAQRHSAHWPQDRTGSPDASSAGSSIGGLRWSCDRQLDLFWSIPNQAIALLLDSSWRDRFPSASGLLGLRVMRVSRPAIETGSGWASWQMPASPHPFLWQWRLAVETDEPGWLVLHHGATDFLERTLPWAAYGLKSSPLNPMKADVLDWSDPMTLELAFGRLALQASDAIKRLDSPRNRHWTLDRGLLRRFDSVVDEANVADEWTVQGDVAFSPSATFLPAFRAWLSRPARGQLKQASSPGWRVELGLPVCASGASCSAGWPENPSTGANAKR